MKVGQAVEYLSQVLSQRGPQAVPYEEGAKWKIREHLSELLKVRAQAKAVPAAGSGPDSSLHGNAAQTCMMHVCASRSSLSRHPTCYASYIQGLPPQVQSTSRSRDAASTTQQHTMCMLACCCTLQMFPHLKVEVSEFHSNSGRCVVAAVGTRDRTAQTASHIFSVLG